MAITWLESGVEWGSGPSFKRSVGYEETARTATTVTYTLYLKLKVQGSGTSLSYYGYTINWNPDGAGFSQIKSATRWYGNEDYRTFTTTIKKTVTASGGNTTFTLALKGGDGSSGAPTLATKTYTAKVSTFNTKPTFPSGACITARENNSSGAIIDNTINGTENAKKIAENIGNIYLSWTNATDAENNLSKYELYCQINDGSWALIYSGANNYFTHNIGSGASTQGKMYDYYVRAVDSYGEVSSNLDFTQFQKNILTGANLATPAKIDYSTSDITLTWSGASNTNGNTSFTYSVDSSDITIYNKAGLTASGGKILILKSGTSTSPYILFEDLKKLSASTNYAGNFKITLTTKNAYGSTALSTATVSFDLRTNPSAPTGLVVGGKVSTSLGSYLIPSRHNATLSWTAGTDYLGGSLTYDVYYKVGTGSEVLVSAGNATTVSIKLPTPTSATSVSFRVVGKTSYGYSATSGTVSDTIHYYNPPTVSLSGYNRTISSMSIKITCNLSTSIPGVDWSKRSYSGNGTTANFTTATYTASLSGLTDSSSFTFTATVNDNTGLSSDVTASYKVTPATPMFSVRENGVGVGVVGGTLGHTLAVKDSLCVTNKDNPNATVSLNFSSNVARLRIAGSGLGTTSGFAIQGLSDKSLLAVDNNGQLYLSGKSTIQSNDDWLRLNPSSTFTSGIYCGTSVLRTDGSLQVGNGGSVFNCSSSTFTYSGNKIYHAGNKPSASDVGAIGAVNTGTYWGMASPSGDDTAWIRTSSRGIIPYQSGGASALGSAGWRFANGYFNNLDSTTIKSNSISLGDYTNTFYALLTKRSTGTLDYESKFGSTHTNIKITSASATETLYGGVIESISSSTAQGRYLFGNTAFVPMKDNVFYNGTSSHRWSAIYASTGTVYSSSKDEKFNIEKVSKKNTRSSNTLQDTIVQGLKDVELYRYKYKTFSNVPHETEEEPSPDFIGFIGQEIEASNPDFFNLIGSSYEREDTGATQYDIRESSLNGVLMVGLQQALLEIDDLKNRVQYLEDKY